MRFIHLFSLCAALALLNAAITLPAHSQPVRQESIAAIVNQDAITASDLAARMRLIMVSSGLPDTAEMKEKIQPQILNMLIEEQLKMQEAAKNEIIVTPQDIENGFKQIAAQNNMNPEQFRQVLRRDNIPASTIEAQIRAQIAWGGVVQTLLKPRIDITDSEIDAMRTRLQDKVGTTEYQISEIFLPVDETNKSANVRQLAERLTRELAQGQAPFAKVAGQFSQAASAARGGDIGWVQKGQLADEIDQALAKLDKGMLSSPVQTASGYHILYLRDQRTISEDTLPSPDELYNRIGMERLDRLQRRYLMDLKAAAFIEKRV